MFFLKLFVKIRSEGGAIQMDSDINNHKETGTQVSPNRVLISGVVSLSKGSGLNIRRGLSHTAAVFHQMFQCTKYLTFTVSLHKPKGTKTKTN